MKNLGLIILIICLFSFACEEEEVYSEIPSIKYKDFNFAIDDEEEGFINQIGFLYFEFVDGNGDLGFPQNSDLILDDEIYDVFVQGYTKINGEFVNGHNGIDGEFVYNDSSYNALLPYFEEGVYRKHLKGEMRVRIYINSNQINDTVKYEFQIMDREYNLSNIEWSPELIIP